MASPQLRGYGVQAIPVLLLLLLLLLLPLRVTPGTTCPPPVSIEHADIRVKNYSVNSRERYVCNSGFKRKAGTSTLIECVINKNTNVAHWTTPSLKCIMAISTSVLLVGAGVVMAFLAWYIKSRQPSQPCRVEVETMETVPMTVRASSKEDEDTGA
ncbi:interleukin-15 receptor subunit alpha isoform X5 [Mus musculus]|uniref:Isoform 6 of Interleukin-15 receptor subunit alpha n=1 Tax=Mus musculus TaxID=10090 RepID=Q60819-6|nr:interleukin-15 receptor subunit alpha isoform X5 [Mus musculus]|eukprot:XP_017171184.1 PREDICTED: interleukin-15 receptor subunit alpha isoform X6 [Mus musculus]